MKPKEKIIEAAKAAREFSYSPYSNYRVGAAVMTEDGQVYSGANIENTSYGLTICAERAAMFNAKSSSQGKLVKLVVSGEGTNEIENARLMPCGACRQVMAELLEPDAEIVVDGVGTFTIDDLLPLPFRLDDE